MYGLGWGSWRSAFATSQSDHGGLYHSPSLRGTLNLPGWFGGANWLGAAFDPDTGLLYVPSQTSPIRVSLVEPDPARSDFRYVRGRGGSAAGPGGLPLVKPPYVRLTAIDLNTGEHVWQVPLGDGIRGQEIELGAPDPGPVGGGGLTPPLLTASLLFVRHDGRAMVRPVGPRCSRSTSGRGRPCTRSSSRPPPPARP